MLREARKQNPETVFVLVAMEPAGMDEAEQLDDRRRHAQAELRSRTRDTSSSFSKRTKPRASIINAVTVQNETDAEQEGNMSACLWSQEQEMEFAARFLAPAMRKAGFGYKDLAARSQLQLVGTGDRRTQRSLGL